MESKRTRKPCGRSENEEEEIFGKADRIGDYQHYPRDAISSGRSTT